MTGTAFDFQEVGYAYRAHPALTGVSLSIDLGERVTIIGANGSGKSTLLRIMAALRFPRTGAATALSLPLTEDAFADEATNYAFRRRVGLVFQNPDAQLFNPTVFDELAFGPLQLGWDKERVRDAIAATAGRFQLDNLLHRSPHRLSGGEKQRLAFACVAITDPDVLLLDEPTAALDPRSRAELIAFLARESVSGRTVVTTTHDLAILEEISDRTIVLDDGVVAADGPVLDIIHDTDLLRRTHLIHRHRHAHGDHDDAHAHLHT